MTDRKKTSDEFIKYVFNEDEKRDIAKNMATSVTMLQTAEDNLKAVKSQFKSEIDGYQAGINSAAQKLNNGYEMKTMECNVEYDHARQLVYFTRPDTLERVKERKMTSDEQQIEIPGMA